MERESEMMSDDGGIRTLSVMLGVKASPSVGSSSSRTSFGVMDIAWRREAASEIGTRDGSEQFEARWTQGQGSSTQGSCFRLPHKF